MTSAYCMLTKDVNGKVYSVEKIVVSTLFRTCFAPCPIIIPLKMRMLFMRRNNERPFKAMALTSAILSQLSGSVLIGVFSGRWLDERFATAPLFLIIGIFAGLAAGVYAVITTLRYFNAGD